MTHLSTVFPDATDSPHGLHVLYKREVVEDDFCGIESLISSNELTEDENAISEDVYVIGQRLTQESDLIVSSISIVSEANFYDTFDQIDASPFIT